MEVEAKFSIPDEQTYQRLLEATSLAGFPLVDPVLLHIHDRYADTVEGAILAGGYACRIRQQNDLTFATLKGLGAASGAIHRREELEIELPRPMPPHQWPTSAARDLVLRLSHHKPLITILEVDQTRHRRHLCDGDRVVAELNLDRLQLCQGSETSPLYLELEVELSHETSEEALEQFAGELQDRWGLAPQSQSKFERGLGRFGIPAASIGESRIASETKAPPAVELPSAPGIEPDDPMSEAGRKIFFFHYQRMVHNEPGTRLGEDIEALHDMRVATRRLRAASRVFGPYYKPKAIVAYRNGLKRTGRALGPVRDLDVFRTKTHAYLSSLPQSDQGGLDQFLTVLQAHRDSARERMNIYLDSARYTQFKERFGQFVQKEGMGSQTALLKDGEPRPHRVRHVAPMVIYQRLAAVRAYDEWVSIPDPPPERLHALRIACKRLRYTLEFFREVLGPDTRALIKTIVTIQDHLGNLQDGIVARALLDDFFHRGTWGSDRRPGEQAAATANVPGVQAYLAARQQELEHLLETFPGVWQPVHEREFSRMIAKAVADL